MVGHQGQATPSDIRRYGKNAGEDAPTSGVAWLSAHRQIRAPHRKGDQGRVVRFAVMWTVHPGIDRYGLPDELPEVDAQWTLRGGSRQWQVRG